MQTRSAVKRAAEAAATAEQPRDQVTRSDLPTSKPVKKAAAKKTPAVPKRKRGKATDLPPVKGGWVFPHGMGTAVTPDTTVAVDKEESQPPDNTIAVDKEDFESPNPATAKNSEDSQSDKVGKSPDTPNLKIPVHRQAAIPVDAQTNKQTRLSFRVTKLTRTVKEEPVAEADGEDEPPKKRARLTRSATAKLLVVAKPELGAENTTLVREVKTEIIEEETEAQSTTSVQVKTQNLEATAVVIYTGSLFLFKGAALRDGIATRLGEKITIDATQILHPDTRINVKRGPQNPYGLTPGFSPYPYRQVPTPEACEEVHRILVELHGECKPPEKMPVASLEVAGCGEVPCVLDALLRTLISGNTLMARANAAIQNLAKHYGVREQGIGKGSINWEKVRLSPHDELAQVIRISGDGPKRSRFIKHILDMVYEENLAKHDAAGEERSDTTDLLSLDYMHSMTKDGALAKFVTYPGVGIKTAACVTLFCLQIPCFAVDTHVHKFCAWLGWTPVKADPDNCFRHGDAMVPDHLKYGLHQLFIRHGQVCFKCRKATKPGTKDWNEAPDCPLEHLLTRMKDDAASVKSKRKGVKVEDSENEVEEDDADEESKRASTKNKKPRKPRARAVKARIKEESDTDMGTDLGTNDDADDAKETNTHGSDDEGPAAGSTGAEEASKSGDEDEDNNINTADGTKDMVREASEESWSDVADGDSTQQTDSDVEMEDDSEGSEYEE